MTLVVEDGTGLSNSDAFASASEIAAYLGDLGYASFSGASAADQETAIRRASIWLTRSFLWRGLPLQGRAQALAWPRVGAVDYYGQEIASDSVPREIFEATALAAEAEVEVPGLLTPQVDLSLRVTREKIGPLEFQYASVDDDMEKAIMQQRPVLTGVADAVRHLTQYSTQVGILAV